jgi:ABC-type polysaccharide/polyol phosphate export permease
MSWRHFIYVLYQTTRASFLSQEKNSTLGLIWHLLNPILMTAVLFLVFRETDRFSETENYGLFILIGVIHYNFFVNATSRSAAYFLRSRSLILNTTVPLELLVLRQACIEGVTLLIEILLVLVLGVFMGAQFTATFFVYPLILASLLALGLGASLFLCGLVVFFTDLNYVWSVLCRMLFFLTPVFYSPEIVQGEFAMQMLWLNPLTGLITMAREALLYGGPITVLEAAQALVGPLLVLGLGVVTFSSARPKIPDYI